MSDRSKSRRDKKLLQAVISFIESLLPRPGLFISIKDPKTDGKMVIIRKLEKPKIHLSEECRN